MRRCGPDGRIDCVHYGRSVVAYDLTERASGLTAILLHPHPDMGGTRFHPIIDTLYRQLPVSTLRFDFSSSDIATAQAEARDAIDLTPGSPVVLIGYSFGADVALSLDEPEILGWFLIAPPLRLVDAEALCAGTDLRPKYLAVPDHDQFSSPERARDRTSRWMTTTVVTLPDSDHFLVGHTAAVVDAVLAWLLSIHGYR
jgi:uncharacterized protein